MTQLDLAAETAAVVNELRALSTQLSDSPSILTQSAATFVDDFLDLIAAKGSQASISGMVALPLLVHGAETGEPHPARAVAVAHLLWWAAARHLDDLVDMRDSIRDVVETNKLTLTATAVGSHLTAEILAHEPGYTTALVGLDPEIRLGLLEELSRGWLDAVDGQLTDLTADPVAVKPEQVLLSYRGKTGAPYAMAAAMAAVLAGRDREQVDHWREFGGQFGVLRQLVNDQRDLVSGRNEDLRNGTATYLLAHYLRSLDDDDRAAVMKLVRTAADSADARSELAARLLAPSCLRSYADTLAPLIAGLHKSIDTSGGVGGFLDQMHDLVEETAGFFPQFLLGVGR